MLLPIQTCLLIFLFCFGMADSFKFMVMNAPLDTLPIDMGFGFHVQLPIEEFLNKIDFPNLFHNVPNWSNAQFKFHAYGMDDGHFIGQWFLLKIECHNYTLDQLPAAVIEAFNDLAKFYFDSFITISKMYIILL